jgi:hypothetical protein
MRITQVFKSSTDGQEISEIEICRSHQATPVPQAMRRESRVQEVTPRSVNKYCGEKAVPEMNRGVSPTMTTKITRNAQE